MADIFCPTCRQRFDSMDELRLHGTQNHEGISPWCRLCDRRFKHQIALYTHIRSGSKAHRELHALRCRIPQCHPEKCIGSAASLGNAPTTAEPSLAGPPSGSSENAAAAPDAQATQATASQAPLSQNESNKTKKTQPCYVCNKELGENGRAMHMKTSTNHRQKHARLCKVRNCDPTTCYGLRQTHATSATAAAVKPSAAPARARTIVEPGPPDPPSSSSTGAGSAQPGPPPTSTSNTNKPASNPPQAAKKKAKKKKVPTANISSRRLRSSRTYEDTSYRAEGWEADGDWFPQWEEHSMYGRGFLECNFCHAPVSSGGRWDHSCPGDSD